MLIATFCKPDHLTSAISPSNTQDLALKFWRQPWFLAQCDKLRFTWFMYVVQSSLNVAQQLPLGALGPVLELYAYNFIIIILITAVLVFFPNP